MPLPNLAPLLFARGEPGNRNPSPGTDGTVFGTDMLSSPGMRYQDLGPDYYQRQASVRRQIACHAGKLGALGFEVTLCRVPAPEPRESASTPAA